jgi:uncharacterized membrane protein
MAETATEQATERVIVKASPTRCFEVATDFHAYPAWSAMVKKVDVVEQNADGQATVVRFWAEAIGRTTAYTLRYDYSQAPMRLSWTLIEGDIEDSVDGAYTFEPVDDQTELTYELSVALRVPMPGFVRRRVEGRILGAALHELKARAENFG